MLFVTAIMGPMTPQSRSPLACNCVPQIEITSNSVSMTIRLPICSHFIFEFSLKVHLFVVIILHPKDFLHPSCFPTLVCCLNLCFNFLDRP